MITKGQKIHTRRIDIATYEGAADSVIVEGTLHVERLFDMHLATGEVHPPGTIHHMVITMEISNPALIIKEIEVDMPTVPHEDCRQTQGCLNSIKGIPIVSGFTAKIKHLVGGTKGCYHLVALLTAMAPAAVQGAWSMLSREPLDPEFLAPLAMERMKNTCWLWREDGPLVENFRKFSESVSCDPRGADED
jgi:hypothetical protein